MSPTLSAHPECLPRLYKDYNLFLEAERPERSRNSGALFRAFPTYHSFSSAGRMRRMAKFSLLVCELDDIRRSR